MQVGNINRRHHPGGLLTNECFVIPPYSHFRDSKKEQYCSTFKLPFAFGRPTVPLVFASGALRGAVAARRSRYAARPRPAASERMHGTPLAGSV